MNLYEQIHTEAVVAGNRAANDFFDKNGEPLFCGFAWVVVKNLRDSFTKQFIKNLGDEIVGENYGGSGKLLYLSHLIKTPWVYKQSMDIKEVFCHAYAAHLRSHGIDASVRVRPD